MSKTLIAYFSATGTTAKVASKLANSIEADLFEIKPAVAYTSADLNWQDKNSRSSKEMTNKTYRPKIADGCQVDMNQYDVIFVGFPIWWYVAPTIINTFLEQYDLSDKKVIPFATSGSSKMGNTNQELKPSCLGAQLLEGQRFDSGVSADTLKNWALKYM